MSPLRIALVLTVVLLVVGGGHLYLYRRLFHAKTTSRRIRLAGAGLLTLLALSLVLARVLSTAFHSQAGHGYWFIAWCWMGFAVYVALTLGAVQLVHFVRVRVLRAPEPERR